MKLSLICLSVLLGSVSLSFAQGEGKKGPRKSGHPGFGPVVHQLVVEKYDANRDGKLDDSEREAIKADAKKLKEEAQAARKAKMLEKFDTNKNGQIDEDEKEAMKAQRKQRREAHQAEMLKKFDKDNDGKLSKEERPGGKRGKNGHFGKPGKKNPHAGFGPEVRLLGMKLLKDKYDANRDGKLDKSERETIQNAAKALKPAKPEGASCPNAQEN